MRWVWKSRFVRCQNESEKYRKWTYILKTIWYSCEWTLRVSENTGDRFQTRISFFVIFSNFFLMPVTLTAVRIASVKKKLKKIVKSQIWVFGSIFCFLLAQRSVVDESVMYLKYVVYFHGLRDPFWHPANQKNPTHLNSHCNYKGILL